MNDIFVSYRRSDSSAIVGRVIDRLETNFGQEHIFRDLDKIEYGQDFGEVIKEALAECEVLLVIIGDKWIHIQDEDGLRRLDKSDDWVRVEVSKALELGIHVIPVLVENAIMPSADQLPEGLSSLATRNAAKVRDDPDFNIDMERLCAAIKKILSKSRKEAKKPFTKFAVLLAIAVTLSVIGGLIFNFYQAGISDNIIDKHTDFQNGLIPAAKEHEDLVPPKPPGWVMLGTRDTSGQWSETYYRGGLAVGEVITFTDKRSVMSQSPQWAPKWNKINNYNFGKKLAEYKEGEKARILQETSIGLGRVWAKVEPVVSGSP